MNYEWKILYIKTKDYPDMPKAIFSCRVEYVGTNEEGKSGRHEMTIPFPAPSLETFVPYENLEESAIVSWFENNFSQEHWDHMHENINNEIANDVIKQSSLPWV